MLIGVLSYNMSSSYLIKCQECEFEKIMIGDEFAQWAADKHQDETNHSVSIRDTSTNRTIYSSPK
jgi:hypothetical protein